MTRSERPKAAVRGKLRKKIYETARFLDLETRRRIGLRVPCRIYVQDPATAAATPELGLQEIDVGWEPSLADGPTSARLAVIDSEGDTGALRPPARWDEKSFTFLTDDGRPVHEALDSPQFRQVNAWATVQRALEYYEEPRSLGRPIPWGFEGNRLLIVPHAGQRENAYYDRESRSLRFFYYGDPQAPRYTCLSHDVIAHETGHALLDGIRPYFLEHSSWETAAFHEFIGDLTTILLALRNNDVRRHLNERFGTELARAGILADVAEELGSYVSDRPFLRTARNSMTFGEAQAVRSAHEGSQVLTGAMFDVLVGIAGQYLNEERQAGRKRRATPAQALWWAAERFGRTALQPLDLLPPVDVRFLDYARAVLRNDELTDPADPCGYRPLIRRVFHERGLCPRPFESCDAATCVLSLPKPPRLPVSHDLAEVSRSRTAAYRLVHDNRERLGIPWQQDFVIADLYDCNKLGRSAERLPRQVVIEYVWREDVRLEERRFGRLRGKTVPLFCGGTLVFDDRGNLLWWTARPGGGSQEGGARREELLDYLAQVIADRRG